MKEALDRAARVRDGVRAAALVLVLLGCALRTAQYAAGVSLWHDELAIARNVEAKPTAALLTEPLDHQQVAPVGFLAAVAASARLLALDELGLRAVPWLLALASMALFWRVAARFSSGLPLLAGLTLFAVSPALTFYGASVKPYVADVAVTLLLLLFALRQRERPEDLRRALLAGIAGGAALLLSLPAVLVAAVVGAVLVVAWWAERPRARLGPLAAMVGLWAAGATLAALAALALRDADTLAYMREFWGSRGGFPPPELLAALAWPLTQLFAVFAHFLLFITPPVLVAAIAGPACVFGVVGLLRLARRSPVLAALLLAPIAAAWLGAFAGWMPFRHRTGLYVGSSVLVLCVAGLEGLRTRLSDGRARWLAGLAASLVALPLALIVLLAARPPYPTQEARPVLQELARRWQPDDELFVYSGGRHAIEFYGRRAGLAGWTPGSSSSAAGLLRELDAFRGEPRLWFFFTQSHGEDTLLARSYLRTIGRERDAIPDPIGAGGEQETAAYLFDLSDRELLGRTTADTFALASEPVTR